MTTNFALGPSWLPKLGGLIAVFSAASTLIPDNAPGANYIKPWVPFLNALAVGLVGFTARQNNKSTEEVTGKTPTPVVPVEPIAKP